MNKLVATAKAIPSGDRWRLLAALAALLVILAAGFVAVRLSLAAHDHAAHDRPPSAVPQTILTAEELEARYGVRIRLVGLTAADGMIDVRVKVLDPQKARLLFSEHSGAPALYLEATGQVLRLPEGVMHHGNPVNDKLIFVLIPNANNAVRRGDRVSVIFGEVRLESVTVQ